MIAEMKAADSAWDLWNKTRDRYWLGYSEAIRDAADIERKLKGDCNNGTSYDTIIGRAV